jgi:hypothetical protein
VWVEIDADGRMAGADDLRLDGDGSGNKAAGLPDIAEGGASKPS